MARCHRRVQTIYTTPSHNASLCPSDGLQRMDRGVRGVEAVEAGRLDTEAETHLKTKRLFSLRPHRKCVHLVFFIHSAQRAQLGRLPLCFPPRWLRFVCGLQEIQRDNVHSTLVPSAHWNAHYDEGLSQSSGMVCCNFPPILIHFFGVQERL